MAANQIPCSSVWMHAFEGDHSEPFADRCRGIIPPPPSPEECLVYAGHCGISLGDEVAIYGFLPHAPQLQPSDLLNELKNETAFPGRVDDHQPLFDYAVLKGRQVIRLQSLYPDPTVAQVRATILQQQKSCRLMYAFPGVHGSFNCATWIREIGLQIPEPTGLMRDFIPAMRALLPNAPLAVGGCVV